MKIPVFYRPEQSSDAANSFSPSAGKPKLVMDDWMSNSEIAPYITQEYFSPASDDILCGAHDPAYVSAVLSGEQENGFGNRSPEIAQSLRYTVGSIVAAAKHVLNMPKDGNDRVAVSPTSGFHHAGYDFGEGFCTFNGLIAAAVRVHALGLAKRILILDFDQHYGNGTDDIIKRLGLDYIDHITAQRSYKSASQAMTIVKNLKDGMSYKNYDLVIYQAGADIHEDDPLGGLLSTKMMMFRDQMVFDRCGLYRVPVVWNLAGGYQRDAAGTIEPVLALHRNTMLACIEQSGL